MYPCAIRRYGDVFPMRGLNERSRIVKTGEAVKASAQKNLVYMRKAVTGSLCSCLMDEETSEQRSSDKRWTH